MRHSSVVVSALAAVAALSLTTGCVEEQPVEGSSLEIPLVQTGADGTVFRLSQATFEIIFPDMTTQQVSGDVNQPSITIPLAPGHYGVRLVDGWTLERSTDGGMSFASVQAVMGNQNPQPVAIFPDTDQQVVFRFYVRDAGGSLSVTLGVVADPQQLLGTLSFAQATGALANYVGKTVDYSLYFDGSAQRTAIENGVPVRHYLATGVGAEFLNDPIGLFNPGPIGRAAVGGTLDMVVRANPDGTQEVIGTFYNVVGNPLSFGPAPVSVGLDAMGFPLDAAFAATAPFSLTGPTSTAAGTTTIRHALN